MTGNAQARVVDLGSSCRNETGRDRLLGCEHICKGDEESTGDGERQSLRVLLQYEDACLRHCCLQSRVSCSQATKQALNNS